MEKQDEEASIPRKQTVDLGELYENINLMYENHSPMWHERVAEAQQQLDKEM
jgi:hypothetical protein